MLPHDTRTGIPEHIRTGQQSVVSWVCYLLECADGTFYCGITNDMDKRLAAHNAGDGAKYTRGRAPLKLAYCEPCADKSAALKREIEIKNLPRAEKLALAGAGPGSAAS